MLTGTEHGPDTLDFRRTSKQDHVRAHACMCAHVQVRFGDVAVLLRNSKDQKVRKLESEKRRKKLDRALGRSSNASARLRPWAGFESLASLYRQVEQRLSAVEALGGILITGNLVSAGRATPQRG